MDISNILSLTSKLSHALLPELLRMSEFYCIIFKLYYSELLAIEYVAIAD